MPPAKNTRSTKPSGPPPSEDFVFTAPNGEQITLPPMGKAMSAGEMRRYRNHDPLSMIYYIIERDHPENPEIFDAALNSMSLEIDVPDLVKQWREFSRTSVGEFSAS